MDHSDARPRSFRTKPWQGPLRAFFASLTAIAVLIACGADDQADGVGQPAAEPGSQPKAADATQPRLTGITTYAGSGSPRFSGDGGPAIEAGFNAPTGVALDGEANLYIGGGKRVRKVDASSGLISTVAGSGGSLTLGDGGPALEAGLREPRGLAVDGSGNLLIVDNGTGRIRKVNAASGVITTVAGGGAGDPLEKIFGDGGPATEALVKLPYDVAMDSEGNLYIATDNRIRKVNAATGIIDTIAGSGHRGVEGDGGPATSAMMAEPVSVALDDQGNIYIVDSENHRIRRVDAATGIMTTVAGIGKHYERTSYAYQGLDPSLYDRSAAPATGFGYAGDGGPADQALLQTPSAIGLDRGGNIFIADGNVRVRRIDAATGVITTVVAAEAETTIRTGKVEVLTTTLGEVVAIVINDQGELFLADKKNNVVHKVSALGAP